MLYNTYLSPCLPMKSIYNRQIEALKGTVHRDGSGLKVHKIEIFYGFDFEICNISLLVM
jgi:hypothetical protein